MTADFTTQDMWEATWLLANGIEVIRTEFAYGLVQFTFDDEDAQATNLSHIYRTGNPSLPVRTTLNASKRIRTLANETRGRAA